MPAMTAQFRREALLVLRGHVDALNPLAFYMLGALLLGIGLGTAGTDAAGAAAGMIWTLTLFATMLACGEMFRRDEEDGTLELLLVYASPRYAAVLAKLAVQWLVVGLPVASVGPLAFLALGGEGGEAASLAASLFLGTPALVCIGAVGAALTVGIGGRGLLFAVLVLPLYLPALIFGLEAAAGEQSASALLFLAALSAASVTAAPFAIGPALALSQEY